MRIKHLLFGKPRDVHDPHIFHKISLIAFLAWVGLGADGLSSSAYGPDEAFRGILGHTYLAIALALATAGTVFIISLAYSKLIEHFPAGGGGYVVATHLLGPSWGVVSGCALLVDYVLTVTVSIASAVDQIFSLIPQGYERWKLPIEILLVVVLIILNLRGVKESVKVVVPIFMLFVITHAVVLVGCVVLYGHNFPVVASQLSDGLRHDIHEIGLWGIFLIFVRAYSRGAGTYTGIEAVSNGVPIMREPKIATAKRTMIYMATSLAVTAGGILFCYLLTDCVPVDGKTLNAVLIERLGIGEWFVVLSLVAEGGLLIVAAQTGFIDGPRVMANMSLDGWLPNRFSAFSERLTTHYGVLLIGGAGLLSLLYTGGNVDTLVTMYSINVFVTFSLSQLGMCRFWLQRRRAKNESWKRALVLHGTALVLCVFILVMVVAAKFAEGAWLTLVVTSALIVLCWLIRQHYRNVRQRVRQLSEVLDDLPKSSHPAQPNAPFDPAQPTAVILVAGYSGLGVHSLLAVMRTFPRHYKQVVFASVAVLDSGNFKGAEEAVHLEAKVRADLEKYCELARGLGFPAAHRMAEGIDPVAEAVKLCDKIGGEFPHAVFFGGKLVFQKETWWNRMLHNETANAIQRRLQWLGRPMLVMPVRVAE